MVKITLGVDGMMCNMCEAHMNDAVRDSFKVKKVSSSHKDKKVEIIAPEEIPKEQLGKVVADTGYTLTSYSVEPYKNNQITNAKEPSR